MLTPILLGTTSSNNYFQHFTSLAAAGNPLHHQPDGGHLDWDGDRAGGDTGDDAQACHGGDGT